MVKTFNFISDNLYNEKTITKFLENKLHTNRWNSLYINALDLFLLMINEDTFH